MDCRVKPGNDEKRGVVPLEAVPLPGSGALGQQDK